MDACSSYDHIKLIVEGKSFICDRNLLTNHSEYFKRILGPNNFKESGAKELEVKDVEYNIMELILKLTFDSSYVVGEENILMVLQAADMLQFHNVLELCITQVTELISEHTCIKIWFMTEHIHSNFGSVPIYLKAKTFALREFETLKDKTYFMELNISQLCSYLANTQLHCTKEIYVFQVFMKWWYDNCKNNDKIFSDSTRNFICLLFCLNFNAVSISDINEMLTYPDLNENAYIVNYLNCLIQLKLGKSTHSFSNEVVQIAQSLLTSKTRARFSEPYFIMYIVKLNSKSRKEVTVVDKYKRKRTLYEETEPFRDTVHEPKSISYYNIEKEEINHFLLLPDHRSNLMEGCEMIAYKEFILFFGGETAYGRGNWNLDFWVYDTIKEIWLRKTRLPNGRRHFQCCIVDSKVFMVGGTGTYRVLQNDMLFYDYKSDIWSRPIELPYNAGSLKCCNFLGQLLLIDSTVNVAYLFSLNYLTFGKICFDIKSLPPKYSAYSVNDKLYIKGVELLEFKLCNGCFILQERFPIASEFLVKCDKMSSVLCSNYLYTIYKDGSNITIEKLDVQTKRTTLIDDVNTDDEYKLNGGTFRFRYTNLFAFSRFDLFKEDSYVNNFHKYMNSTSD